MEKDIFLKSPLKWAGGKAKLMDKIEEVYSKDFFLVWRKIYIYRTLRWRRKFLAIRVAILPSYANDS